MADINALYPKAPDPGGSSLASDPLKLIGVIGQLNQNALFQQTFAGRKAVGEAYQHAIRPDGSIDTQTLMREIKSRPDAGFLAGEASAGALSRQGQQLDIATKGLGLNVTRNQFVIDGLGTLADKPNLSMDDVHDFAVRASRNVGIPPSMVLAWTHALPKDPAQLRQSLVTLRNMAMGSTNAATPDTTGYGPDAAPISGTRGQAGYERAGVGAAAPVPTPDAPAPAPNRPPGIMGLPAGYSEAAQGIAGASAAAANALTAANDTSMTRKGMLGNLEEDLQHFTSGPGADWQKVAKAWVNRNVPMPQGWQFDPKSIASQEQFTKQATQLVQAQFQAIGGTGTDAKFNSAYETSPNDTLSQLGNKGIVRLLKGNEDAIQAKNRAWQQWLKSHGPQTYPQFSAAFNEHFDPRSFQFKYVPKEERQGYIDRMDPADRDKFVSDLTYAHDQGWIGFEAKRK